MVRQSMPSGSTRGCKRFGDEIMRRSIVSARSDAKPPSTVADRAGSRLRLSDSAIPFKRPRAMTGCRG